MSLRTKFTLFIFVLVTLIILGIFLVVFLNQSKFLSVLFETNRERLFKDFSYTCKQAALVRDEILIINTLKSVVETYKPQIVYVGYAPLNNPSIIFVRDPGREVEFISRIFHEDLPRQQRLLAFRGERILEYSVPLRDAKDVYLGTVKIGFSENFLTDQIKQSANMLAKQILVIFVITLFLSFILSNLLAAYLVKPIKILTKAAIEIGKGHWDVKTNIKRKDEIGILAKTFEKMASEVKQLDELKDSFVSSVSHELRSPLSAIDGYVDFLIEGLNKGLLDRDKQLKALNIIKDSVNRLTTFINNILDLAKIKAGKFEIHKSPVKIEEIIKEVIALFEQLAVKQKKNLEVDIREILPEIYADPERVKQVLINLIGNALKFTDENATITVSARVVKENKLLGYKDIIVNPAFKFVEVSVKDTGCGIPENEIDKIFEKFYQVGGTTHTKPKGTGLGLSIVMEILKLHGGSIGVESVVGKGSTFKFLLPINK